MNKKTYKIKRDVISKSPTFLVGKRKVFIPAVFISVNEGVIVTCRVVSLLAKNHIEAFRSIYSYLYNDREVEYEEIDLEIID